MPQPNPTQDQTNPDRPTKTAQAYNTQSKANAVRRVTEQGPWQRDFTATRPNQKWVPDRTPIPTHTGWLYLAVLL